ncbi:hypothetical protein F183_A26280 [Bryobacterales bacterium F-183]|nr:hypothetical protein F183_A26280 [Bryobacterales bacterium F-183]
MELRFALRSLLKNPGFTILAVLVLALGMGANTAIFSVVNAVLLRPLPYPEPDRIAMVYTKWAKSGRHGQTSAPDFHDWRQRATSFDALSYFQVQETNVLHKGVADYANVAMVAPGFFDIFRIRPTAGRLFSPSEEKRGAQAVALVSEAYAARHLGSGPSALGQSIQIDGKPYQVVGVLPFSFPKKAEIWYSSGQHDEILNRTAHNYWPVARLKAAVPVEQANAEIRDIAAALEQQFPKENRQKSAAAVLLQDDLVGDMRRTLGLLFAAVALVVLIACANVANLLLAKATARTREIAVRSALGAGRWDVVRLMLTECLLLALAASAVGFAAAFWGVDLLVAAAPKDLPRLDEIAVDWRVFTFSLGTSLASTLLFGLAPALSASKLDLNEALKQTSRTTSGGASRLRSMLVVAEIAMSVVLAIGAGLLVKSMIRLGAVEMGFKTEKLLLGEAAVTAANRDIAAREIRYYKDGIEKITAIPGVIAAGAVTAAPGTPSRSNGAVQVEGVPFDGDWSKLPNAIFTVATPGYLDSIGIPLLRGRDFNDRDTAQAPYTVIINDAFAKLAFPGQDPIGRRIRCGYDSPEWMTIVGVSANIRQQGPAEKNQPELLMPYQQHPYPATYMTFTVRTASDPQALQETIRTTLRKLNAQVPVRFATMELTLQDATANPRFRTFLLTILATLAVVLALIGVYGVMAYSVSQRLGEIGLRMALGANSNAVLRLVLREGLSLAAVGLAIGLAAALGVGRLIETLLFDVKPLDASVFATVGAGVIFAVLLAAWMPAWRASKLDPASILRQE